MQFKTTPFRHQLEEYMIAKDMLVRAEYWEMGTGKSKPVLDQAAYLHEQGKINGLIIVAPNGVHTNWVTDEIPSHMPDATVDRMKLHHWVSSKASTKKHADSAKAMLAHPKEALSVLCMSYDGVKTDKGVKVLRKMLDSRQCMYVLDESPKIKTPGSGRTIRILASAKKAPYRRILTGTLVDDKPFDVYTQIKFLDPHAWEHLGISGAEGFRNYFGVWGEGLQEFVKKSGETATRVYPKFIRYRNFKDLQAVVAKYGSRHLKSEVLDLPPKLYSKRYFEMTPAQKRAYKDLATKKSTLLPSGDELTVDMALVGLIRFQQITSGYLPSDDDVTPQPLEGGADARLKVMMDTVEETGYKPTIIWAKYTHDIDLIMERLKDAKRTAARYDGQCSDDECLESKQGFIDGRYDFFVANTSKGCEGLTLVRAKTMIYYNNYFRLSYRRQSEDRFHRIGQTDPVNIIDLCATGTIDNRIIDVLREKQEWASAIMGDPPSEWI